MFEKYAPNYYKGLISAKEVANIGNVSLATLYATMKKEGYLSYRKVGDSIHTSDPELNNVLREKYAHIKSRCKGNSDDPYGHYKGLEYLDVVEWANFCNTHMAVITDMWNEYLKSGRDLAYCPSIDRIDNNKGYLPHNMAFVTHGFNSWKRSATRPIKARRVGDSRWEYFMSCKEGSIFFQTRPQSFSEVLVKHEVYYDRSFEVEPTTQEEVLESLNVSSLQDYYFKYCFKNRRIDT